MYGLADRDKSGSGHVVAGLIERASRAKIEDLPLQVWGSGQATRDFISAEHVSQLIIELLDKNTHELNIASGIEVSIHDLAANVAAAFNLDKGVVFTGENEGIIRRYSDITKLRKFLPNFNCGGIDSFFKTIAP
jgi:GDP-L-fucose synthase